MQKLYKRLNLNYLLSVCITIFIINGCLPHKEIVYFQDHSDQKDYENPFSELEGITNKYKLRPNDRLYVNVSTSHPKLSEYFNQGRSSNTSVTGQNLTLFTYLIDDEMNIDFPYVGKINLENCTREEAKDRIIEALIPFLNDAQVIVRLYNPSFIALGEFGRAGRIEMGKEQVTIFEAVALAGDIRPLGKKKKVQIVRPTPEGSITYFVDLTDINILDSEQYYIYSNDILYIRPMKARMWGIGESFSFGAVTSVIAFTVSIFALSRVF